MSDQGPERDLELERAADKRPGQELDARVDHTRLAELVAANYTPPVASTAAVPPPARKPKYFTPLILAAALSVLLALLSSTLFIGPGPVPKTTNKTDPPSNVSHVRTPTRRRLVAIPGGTFLMGRDEVAADPPSNLAEYPAHAVVVNSFYMDEAEVTHAEYAEFVHATGYPVPGGAGKYPPVGREQWPVTYVSYADAQAFAEWRSKRDGTNYRLPTEEEWEYAARRGGRGLLYPWGNEWLDGAANIDSSAPRAVGSYPQGASVFGVHDLIGNVWEWTSSRASVYPNNDLIVISKEEGEFIVTRGGSHLSGTGITAATRQWVPPATTHPALGFRLVSDNF